MRTWFIYGAVVLVSVVAGVMLGGGPGALLGSSESSPFVSSADDVPPAAPEVEDFTVASAPSTTERSEPAATDAPPIPTDSVPVESATAPESSTSIVDPAPTTTTNTATTTDDEVIDTTSSSAPADEEVATKADLSVAVLNGIGTPGLASRVSNALIVLGYTEPVTRDTAAAAQTLVYFRTGLDAQASLLAVESGLPANAILSFDNVGDVVGVDADEFDLILILGGDRIGLASA